MIVKSKQTPPLILKLQALSSRILPHHIKHSFIKDDLARYLAGFKGEKSIEYYLSFLPDEEYYIFHDIRLFDGEHFFQLDALILTKRLFCILEIKNLAGIIEFDKDFNQIIQIKNGQEKAYPDPTTQLQRQKSQLNTWLKRNNLPQLPMQGFVVFSNPQTVIKSNDKFTKNIVIKNHTLSSKISDLQDLQEHQKTDILTQKDIKRIIRIVMKLDTPLDNSIIEQYQLSRGDIVKGVFCEVCKHIPLQRIHGYWYCSHCTIKSKDAHLAALKDYQLLFGELITSNQLKEFLQINCSSLATRILKSVSSSMEGEKKGRVYTLTK
ncbi:nuclease-related domain-containing protein [Rossellomorea oryzaecorticis]|uniref:Nuclease-related domain-containing protein n=1 Tax=Rossellomorea oryzaecorticis TaxID=1396505 RepID=A0ABU9KEH4_9BACI